MNRHYFFGIALTLASTIAIIVPATAQTTNPELNNLLRQTNEILRDSQQFINQIERESQQREANLQYSCYQLGNPQDCVALQQFYQRRMQGYDAGIDYYERLQQNGWADSFGTLGN